MANSLSRYIRALLIFSMFTFPLRSRADDGALPSEMFTAIMLKALNYDRNIDRHAKDKVTIGIISSPDETGDFAGQVKDNIDKIQSSFLLKDKPLDAIAMTLSKPFDKPGFEEQLKQSNISVIVVAVNDPAYINNIVEAAKDLQLSSICGNPGCATKGVALAIIQRDDKPHILVNLNTAMQEGCDFNSKFLAMCEVVK